MAGNSLDESVATIPEAHHCIGKSQNHPEHMPLFLQSHARDPAIKVTLTS
jgi:hypothetical protein